MTKKDPNKKPVKTEEGWRYEHTPHQHRRHRSHNYRDVGTYLITMTVAGGARVFGHVEGKAKAKRGEEGFATFIPTELGKVVLTEERQKIERYYPMVEVWQFCLMPDHIHMIIRIKSTLPPKKHLGTIIGAFMGGISRAWWRMTGQSPADAGDTGAENKKAISSPGISSAGISSPDASSPGISSPGISSAGISSPGISSPGISSPGISSPGFSSPGISSPDASSPGISSAGISGPAVSSAVCPSAPVSAASAGEKRGVLSRRSLFDEGYNDHILMRPGQLNNWKAYLADNPHRLLLRQSHPDLMRRSLCLTIGGTRYSAFGNFMLLKRPEKVQGQCHRVARYGDLTDEERRRYGCPVMSPDSKTRIAYELTQHFHDNYRRTMMPVRTGAAVLITPGISEGEKMMKQEALTDRLPFIHLQKEPITPRWKPEQSRFYACVEGTLLILAPWQEDMNTQGGYATFHKLNDLAAALCAMDVSSVDFSVSFNR